MTLITVTERDAFTIDGVFFAEPVLLLVPDVQYITAVSAKEIARNTIKRVGQERNVYGEEAYEKTTIKPICDGIKRVLVDECVTRSRAKRQSSDFTREIEEQVSSALPRQSRTQVVSNPGRLIHLTRLVIQTVFDQLSIEQTHMSVRNPFELHDTWNEINVNYSTTKSPDFHTEVMYALMIKSPYFEQPVTMQVPLNNIVCKTTAKTATENIFEHITKHVGIHDGTFTPMQTTVFASLLKRTVKVAIKNAVTDTQKSTKTEINRTVNTVIPDKPEFEELPDTISSPGVIIHMTRMAVQGVYAEFSEVTTDIEYSEVTTNFHVDNPLRVKDHKWNETIINRIVDSPTQAQQP